MRYSIAKRLSVADFTEDTDGDLLVRWLKAVTRMKTLRFMMLRYANHFGLVKVEGNLRVSLRLQLELD